MAEVKTIDITTFFSKKNEDNGIWYEPKVNGVPVGFEVKVYGPNSSAATVARDTANKAEDEANKIADAKTKSDTLDKIIAQLATDLVSDIRGKDGNKIVDDKGEAITKDDIYNIMFNSPVLATDITRFQRNQNNFLSPKSSN